MPSLLIYELNYGKMQEMVWESGIACQECPFYKTWTEHHGPGLNEPMAECTVGDYSACPGLDSIIKAAKEAAEDILEFCEGGARLVEGRRASQVLSLINKKED